MMCKQWIQSRAFSVTLMTLGIAMLVYGLHTGEAEIVLAKAIRICMECIGIG